MTEILGKLRIAFRCHVPHLNPMQNGAEQLLAVFEEAALQAGQIILTIYRRGCGVAHKSDESPVTEADITAEACILALLKDKLPDIPIIAEEQMSQGIRSDISGGRFILIDPLDGTREFISHNGEFTVNIALIDNGVPIAGIVYAPALGTAYLGGPQGAWKLTVDASGAVTERHPIHARAVAKPPVAMISRSHLDEKCQPYLKALGVTEYRQIGSSLKFGLLAEGLADLYLRYNRTMEWDTAAGDAVLRAAGGSVLTADGAPLTYGKINRSDDADFANPGFFAWGRRDC
ncbi:3'(2'),5'-bisphosphate nucleotidase CysQ [Rhizobium helianthi]|uniref:3'(2'),5'-bisphosphate nucleotidase CysQ n=1 Tax=Rhizobium helianthi TaxID=1132695 RepID=A0ABW4M2W8_9HYPH